MTEITEISNDNDLKEICRSLTMYEDSEDELPSSKLNGQLLATKMKLQNRIESDTVDWYSSNGLTTALLFSLCITAKVGVENYSIDRWDLGEGIIDVSGASDAEDAQFGEWATAVEEGLDGADEVECQTPKFSSTYIGQSTVRR